MPEYRIKGAFFENTKDVGPAFTGFVEIDGVKTSIALWPKTSKAGANYLQVSEDKKQQNAGGTGGGGPLRPRAAPQPKPRDDDMDDSIPF